MHRLITMFSLIILASVFSPQVAAMTLDEVLGQLPDAAKARISVRHPKEVLEMFGVKAGMTVIESFPGGGWYTNILVPFIGNKGLLIGADYANDMYPKFNFYDDDYLAAKSTWAKTWTEALVQRYRDGGAQVSAFPFGSMTRDVDGKVDVVLLIRALHNLARFENDGGYMSIALKEIMRALKPGGAVGVVQHMAPEDAPDAWANGSNGYLKKSFVIETMTKAGFALVGESDINVNPADQPVEGDRVWRLSPSFSGSGDDPAKRAEIAKIGESTRMTLLFRKPK